LIEDLQRANKRRSALLLIGFMALLTAVAWASVYLLTGGGWVALAIAAVIAGGSAWFSWFKSDMVALRMSRAVPADPTQYRRLHNLVEGLCIASGLPKPRVYVIDDVAPNAFATGRDPQHGAVAVTTGLLNMMTRVELEGVLAHELSHIKNRDITVSTLAVTVVGMVAVISDLAIRLTWWNGGRRGRNDRDNSGGLGALLALFGFALLITAPLVARMFQFALSREREYLADASGVQMTRYPPGLLSALEKLQSDVTVTHSASRATAHMWIEQPVARTDDEGRLAKLNRMFDTHPPLEERIRRLKEL
jgi:heat shock protein HtpX